MKRRQALLGSNLSRDSRVQEALNNATEGNSRNILAVPLAFLALFKPSCLCLKKTQSNQIARSKSLSNHSIIFCDRVSISLRVHAQSILKERVLEDDEFDILFHDIRDTPVYVERTIRREITEGKSSVSSLVPNSRRYFERLVGSYNGSYSIRDYATSVGQAFFKRLSEWRPYEGFLFSLFLSSHSALTTEIKTDHIDRGKLESALEFLEKRGDMLSRLGAFEVGLRILPNRPEVKPFLLRLVHRIRDDDTEGKASEFNLFSALFVLVDGELARTRLLAKEPPFYRRLASLSQAALIHRQLVQCGIDYDHFSKWSFSNRGEHFYMQSLADMRVEPRWEP